MNTKRLLNLLIVALAFAAPAEASRWLVEFSSGTGFYVNRNGQLITNAHVVRNCQSIAVRNGTTMTPASIVAADNDLDLAVLKISGPVPAIAPLRWNIAALQPGDSVAIYGFPGQAGATGKASYQRSTVTGLTGPTGQPQWIQLRSVAQQGNSGGPVLDTTGNVIAVIAGRAETYRTATSTSATPQLVGKADIAITISALESFLRKNNVTYYQASSGLVAYADGILEHNAKKFITQVQCVHKRTLEP